MAKELLDRIIDEIRQRKAESREAYEETQRLQAALAALGQPESRRPASRPMWPSCLQAFTGLARDGELERTTLPGGRVGFRPAAQNHPEAQDVSDASVPNQPAVAEPSGE
jgi:hypothetical protein